MQHKEAFSLLDLENELDTVDKSTIYRTITLFLAHHLIHGIDDGTGSLKYAVCSNDCNCEVDDLHTHFYCENCHRTFCMKSIHVPIVTPVLFQKSQQFRIIIERLHLWAPPFL